MPPHWAIYVAVESADATASSVPALGGKVIVPPFDVMEFGRMAVLQDPTGAVFEIWQPKQHTGIRIEGVAGTLCWADLSSPDPDATGKFYTGLFGWTLDPGQDNSGYLHIKNGVFPPPVLIGERSVGWPEVEVDAIVNARVAGFSAEQVRDLVKSLVAQRANRNPMHEYQ